MEDDKMKYLCLVYLEEQSSAVPDSESFACGRG